MPAYTFPENREDLWRLSVVVVRNGYSRDPADMFLDDLEAFGGAPREASRLRPTTNPTRAFPTEDRHVLACLGRAQAGHSPGLKATSRG